MDFKNILSQLSQLSEATETTSKGRVHKAEPGGYGRKFDTDEEGEEKKDKKAKADAPKRGRGRPKKDSDESGEVKKYDASALSKAFGGGKAPKKPVGKTSVKHSLKEWVEEIENKYVAEAVPPGMKPLAILDPKNQSAGAGVVTSTNPAIQKMLGGLDPKDVKIVMTQQGQQQGQQPQQQNQAPMAQGAKPMAEEGDKKWIQKAIKHPGALRKKLHAKPGEPIPAGKLEKATHSKDEKTARQARLAQTLRGLKESVLSEGFTPQGLKQVVATLSDLRKRAKMAELSQGQPVTQNEIVNGLYDAIVAIDDYLIPMMAKQGQSPVQEGDIPSDQVDMGAGLGAGRKQETFEGKKPDFLDLDKDGNKKEPMKKAAADKKKKKVDESMDTRLKAAHHRGKAHALSKESYNCKYDDMEEARMYHEGYKEGLDECYGQVPIRGGVVDEMGTPPATVGGMADQAMEGEMDEGNAFTAALARTPKGGKFSVGGKTFTDRTGYDAKVDETMFESWNSELSSLLTEYDTIQEGLTVSISKGQQGAPDSVSVTAQDQEADQLLSIIKSAGLGLFGAEGGQQGLDGQSSPMSLQPTDGEPEGHDDIGVVDDHDGMMALIKKVTGGAGEPDTVAIGGDSHDHGDDYEDEEGSDHDHDHEHTDEDSCNECGYMESKCQCDDKEVVDEVESEDQMAYEVAEDNPPDSGAEETEQEVQDTAQANASAADSGGAPDLEEAEEEESEQLDEWANEAGQRGTDAQFETDIAFMTRIIAGGLNKEKSTGQTTVPVIAGQKDRMGYSAVNESIGDWKKLAGLK